MVDKKTHFELNAETESRRDAEKFSIISASLRLTASALVIKYLDLFGYCSHFFVLERGEYAENFNYARGLLKILAQDISFVASFASRIAS